MIDQYAAFVNEDGRDSLGDWIERQRDKNLASKSKAAAKVIKECRVPVDELRHQWKEQKAAQTSIRARKFIIGCLRCVTCPSSGGLRLDQADLLTWNRCSRAAKT